jgi:hypothetical protein
MIAETAVEVLWAAFWAAHRSADNDQLRQRFEIVAVCRCHGGDS